MTELNELSTYRAGVYQAKAYRAFKNMKNATLKASSLTMMQWVVLGYIYDAGETGVRITTLAKDIDTTQAFITTTVNALEDKGFVTRTTDIGDSRAKKVILQPAKYEVVEAIEQTLRQQLRAELYARISREELATYLRVVEKFSQN